MEAEQEQGREVEQRESHRERHGGKEVGLS